MYISIDLGGTNTRVASSKDLKSIHKVEKFPTEAKLEDERRKVNEAIGKVIDGGEVEYICIGVPGVVDRYGRKFEKIVNYPNLNGLKYEDFFDIKVGGANIVVENDAALAGLSEAIRGVGKDHAVIAYLTLSTGVGGIRIQEKRISRIQGNSEPGHMIIVENGRYDEVCGQRGCLHAYVSGFSFHELYNVDPRETTDSKIWDEYGSYLGAGLVNVIAMWDPDVIVIGGGLSESFDLFSGAMLRRLDKQTLFDVPPVLQSELSDDNGILGGFDLISQVLKENKEK